MGNDEEVVILNKPVVCKGNIETWLTNLQNEMYETLMDVCRQVSVSIQTTWKEGGQVIKFIDDFCAQATILGL